MNEIWRSSLLTPEVRLRWACPQLPNPPVFDEITDLCNYQRWVVDGKAGTAL